MNNLEQIAANLYRLTMPYKDIYTTVCILTSEQGAVLFDTASSDEDAENYILPALAELGIGPGKLRYIFISHNHPDHARGLRRILADFPDAVTAGGKSELKDLVPEYPTLCTEDGEKLLGFLRVVAIPGHTADSCALFDERNGILITGDCLQMFGIVGSGTWRGCIYHQKTHLQALDRLSDLPIRAILTAHNYTPTGHWIEGEENVAFALHCCRESLRQVREFIIENEEKSDEEIAELFNRQHDDGAKLKAYALSSYRHWIEADK